MFNLFLHIAYVIFIDDTCLIYFLCNLIDIICSVGKQALQIPKKL